MRITLLGAGHIGQTIARLLAGQRRLRRDRGRPQRRGAGAAGARPVRACRPRPPTRGALLQVLRGQDAVINALPYHLATTAATQAREAGCHYFDLTEDVAATRAIQQLAEGSPTAFMPQCGLAPGFIGIVAHHLAQSFDTLQEVKMRVGALPAFPTNALKYNLTWSVDGLINEYCHPCEAIRDGRNIEVLPLEGAGALLAWTAPSTRPSTPAAAWARCARRWPAACRRWTTRACATPATAR
jgi:saccharopine dehydrogenase-like NADP-dependent oxidoreductase